MEENNLAGEILLIIQRKLQWYRGRRMMPKGSICHIIKLTKEVKMEQMGQHI